MEPQPVWGNSLAAASVVLSARGWSFPSFDPGPAQAQAQSGLSWAGDSLCLCPATVAKHLALTSCFIHRSARSLLLFLLPPLLLPARFSSIWPRTLPTSRSCCRPVWIRARASKVCSVLFYSLSFSIHRLPPPNAVRLYNMPQKGRPAYRVCGTITTFIIWTLRASITPLYIYTYTPNSSHSQY